MTGKIPPAISHIRYSRHDNMTEIVERAAKAIHMSKGERELLKYYAAQSTGFRPSLQAIANATGQHRANVARNRQKMVEQGIALMLYVPEGKQRLIIDWSRLKLYATLDPKLTGRNAKFAPVVPPGKLHADKVTIFDLRYMPLDELFGRLGSMSEDEYGRLKTKVKAAQHNAGKYNQKTV